MGRFNLIVIVVGMIVGVIGAFTPNHPNLWIVGIGLFLFGIVIYVFRRFFSEILRR